MAEDFLPAAPKVLPTKPSSARTFAVWAALMVFFLVLYSVLSETPGKHEPARAGYSVAWILVLGAFAAVLLLLFVALVWQARGSKRFNLDQKPALEALADGNYALADKLYAELAQRYRTKLYACAVATYNRAYTLRLLGKPSEAVGLLVGIDRTPRLATGEIHQLLATELATCFALGGDMEKARRWLGAARDRIAGNSNPAMQAALVELAAGLVACREGKFEEALATFETSWRRLEGQLAVARMREAYLLRAYAMTQLSSPREGATAETWLRLLRVAPPGALAYLVAHWPELEAFAATQDLGSLVGAGARPPSGAVDDGAQSLDRLGV